MKPDAVIVFFFPSPKVDTRFVGGKLVVVMIALTVVVLAIFIRKIKIVGYIPKAP